MKLLFILSAMFIITGNLSGQKGWDMMRVIEKNIVQPVFPEKTYNITDYGAVSDGSTDALPAIRKAIELCSTGGGGMVVVPAGIYFSKGPIVLKSNVNLHLSEGAEILFSTNEKDYLPAVLTRWEGTELFNYSPLIYAYNLNNIAITGKGKLNGQGSKNISNWKSGQKSDQAALRKMGTEGTPLYERVFGENHFLRPAFIEPVSCSNVLIEDVNIVDATFWVIHPLLCRNVTVRGVKVKSFNANNDGCDPESCVNVLIENCNFQTGDDAIAIKSGRDNDGWRVGQPTENVIIRNCVFDSKINGLCIGSELSGGVRNVFVKDIEIISVTDAIFFKSNLDRGGYVQNVNVKNVRVGTVRSSLIKFEPDYKHESKNNYPTLFKGFTIENIEAGNVKGNAIDIAGFEQMPVEDVIISGVTVKEGTDSIVVKNVRNVKIEKLNINGKKIK